MANQISMSKTQFDELIKAIKSGGGGGSTVEIKETTFSGTTSNNGNFNLSNLLDTENILIISAIAWLQSSPSTSVVCIPYRFSASQTRPSAIKAMAEIGAVVSGAGAVCTVFTQTAITGKIYYIELPQVI